MARKKKHQPSPLSDIAAGLDAIRTRTGRTQIALEVGAGDGGFAAYLAQSNPNWTVIAIEKEYAWACKCARQAASVPNLLAFCGDYRQIADAIAGRGYADSIWMNFPCPWPKGKHAARRLSEEDFVTYTGRLLKPGGLFQLATDVAEFHDSLQDIFGSRSEWQLEDDCLRARMDYRTRYEEKWIAQGRSLHFLAASLQQTTAATPTRYADMDAVLAALARQPAILRPHDTEWRRGGLVAKVVRPRRSAHYMDIAVADTATLRYSMAKFTLEETAAGPRWSWTNRDNWIPTLAETRLVRNLAVGQPATEN